MAATSGAEAPKPEAKSLLWVSHTGAGAQGFGPSSIQAESRKARKKAGT